MGKFGKFNNAGLWLRLSWVFGIAIIISATPAQALDLSVSRVSLDRSTVVQSITVAPQETFRYWVTVHRSGTEDWGSTNLTFLMSSDSFIDPNDAVVARGSLTYDDFAMNSFSRTLRYYYDVTAPSQRGVYYYGACIDPVANESSTKNNCGATSTYITVNIPPPNLTVGKLLAPLNPGSSDDVAFTNSGFWDAGRLSEPWIEATITNTGLGTSNATTAELWRSQHSDVIGRPRDRLRTVAVPELGHGESVRVTYSDISLSDRPDTYYYAVRVLGSDDETDKSDNWNAPSDNVAITVRYPPDLAATSFGVDEDFDTVVFAVRDTGSLEFFATVTNVGQRASSQTPSTRNLIFHRGPNDVDYVPLAVDLGQINSLEPNRSQTFTVRVPVPSELGEHRFVYGITDDNLASNACSNNVSDEVLITVVNELPDLDLTEASLAGPLESIVRVLPGSRLNFSASVRNIASAVAPTPTLMRLFLYEFVQGRETTLVTQGGRVSGSFPSGATGSATLSTNAGTELGSRRYALCIYSDIEESHYQNNCEWFTMSIVPDLHPPPDLSVDQVTVNGSSDSRLEVAAGAPLRIVAPVRNAAVSYAMAPDRLTLNISASNQQGVQRTLASITVSTPSSDGLMGQQATSVATTVMAPSQDGVYGLRVCVVGNVPEGADSSGNDCSPTVTLTVTLDPVTVSLTPSRTQIDEQTPSLELSLMALIQPGSGTRYVPTIVNLLFSSGSALEGEDFILLSPTPLIIQPGSQSSRITINIEIIDDNIAEADEVIRITGESGSDTIVPTSINIIDNDVAPRMIEIRTIPEVIHEELGVQFVDLIVGFPEGSSVLDSTTVVTVSVTVDGTHSGLTIRPSRSFAVPIDPTVPSGTHYLELTPVDDNVANESTTITFSGVAVGFIVIPIQLTIVNDDLAPPIQVRARGDDKFISLSWTPSHITSTTPIERYLIQTLSVDERSWNHLASVVAGAPNVYRHSSLDDGQTVTYRIVAEGGDRMSQPSDLAVATTKIFEPSQPLFVKATGSRNRVAVTWNPPTSNGGSAVVHYRIESSRNSSNWQKLATVPIGHGEIFVHRDLPDSQRIYYRIAAINAVGAGAASSVAHAYTSPAYDAALIADINLDGAVTSDDALILYFAYTQQRLLGDGLKGGRPSSRRAILGLHIGDLIEPNDQDFQDLLSLAREFETLSRHGQLDVNQSGEVDAADALIVYYALAHRELLGDGSSGGFMVYRKILLSHLVRIGPERVNDEMLRTVLRRVNDLLDATYSED